MSENKRMTELVKGERRRRRLPMGLCLMALGLSLLFGCDQVTRHKVLSTVFDGVPSLPPAESMCEDYYELRLAADAAGVEMQQGGGEANSERSSHRPYTEKNCDGCHSQNKEDGGSLITSKRKLCYVCHTDFTLASQVHGPVAVGDCLACHLPHFSDASSLLKEKGDELCASCHHESRLAKGMHDRLAERKMHCVDCHDPHSGEARYFLK